MKLKKDNVNSIGKQLLEITKWFLEICMLTAIFCLPVLFFPFDFINGNEYLIACSMYGLWLIVSMYQDYKNNLKIEIAREMKMKIPHDKKMCLCNKLLEK